MHRVMSVLWTMDNKFLLSGSDEMNIRIWKAKAAEKLGPVSFPLLLSGHILSIFKIIYVSIRIGVSKLGRRDGVNSSTTFLIFSIKWDNVVSAAFLKIFSLYLRLVVFPLPY